MWVRLSLLSKKTVRVNRQTTIYRTNINDSAINKVVSPDKHWGFHVYSSLYDCAHLKKIKKKVRFFMLSHYASRFKLNYICLSLLNTSIRHLPSDLFFLFAKFPFIYLMHHAKHYLKKILKRKHSYSL